MESTAIWVAKAIWDAIDEQWAARTGYPNTVRSLDCMPLWALNIANRFLRPLYPRERQQVLSCLKNMDDTQRDDDIVATE